MKKKYQMFVNEQSRIIFMGIFYILLRQIPHWNSIIMSSRKELTAKS